MMTHRYVTGREKGSWEESGRPGAGPPALARAGAVLAV